MSVDGALGKHRWGTGWALAALAAGAAGSATVLAGAKLKPKHETEPEAQSEAVTAP